MYKPNRSVILSALSLFAIIGVSEIVLETDAEARAGGGRSGGFRGSRSYQAPSRPSQPSQPRREATPPPQQPSPVAPQSGGFMRGLGTAVLGGFLGSMLFSGLAHGFGGLGGLGGSGFGLLEIILLAGLGYFLYRKFLSPRVATGYGTMQYQNTGYGTASRSETPASPYGASSAPPPEFPANDEPDFKTIFAMDRNFDPSRFVKTTQDTFFKVQGAWNREDTATLKSICGPELMRTWEEELAALRGRGQKNRLDNIALSSTEITEAWTESGQDYITVRLRANLLDYTVDANSGAVISGSNSEPVEFEEYWTFSRPVGPNVWKLSAVQQA
jgi:predicted lipid-binding transport protein (Tim44 family)